MNLISGAYRETVEFVYNQFQGTRKVNYLLTFLITVTSMNYKDNWYSIPSFLLRLW